VQGSNVGWWVPVLVIAVPFVLLLALHLLARLESWMFEPDERANKVARMLEEMDEPAAIEQEVTRLLAEVDQRAAPAKGRATRLPFAPGRTPAGERLQRSRLRRAIVRSEQGEGRRR